MKNLKGKTVLFLVIIILLVSGIFNYVSLETRAEDKINVYTSFYNLQEIVSKISSEQVEVNVVVPSGAEVHSYEPTPRQMGRIQEADIFFYIGAGLEPWGESIEEILMETDTKVIELSQKLDLREFEETEPADFIKLNSENTADDYEHHEHDDHEHHEHEHHDHEHEHHDHDHGHYDPHVWLDPLNYQEMARIVKEELIGLNPNDEEIYQENFLEIKQQVTELDEKFTTELDTEGENLILVSHAAFGYLGDRYGFEQLAVTGITPHEEPSPGTIHQFIQLTEEREINYIFQETLSSPRVVEVIAEEAELEILSLNPLEGLTEEEIDRGEDYFSIMEQNLSKLKQALGE